MSRTISEQEFKQAFISCLSTAKEFKYSVEPPTINFYKFSGEDISELNKCIKFTAPQPYNAGETLPNTIPDTDKNGDNITNKSDNSHNSSKFISARIDLTLYNPDVSTCHHIEFKAHNPAYKDIAKDILKLFYEPTCNGYTHYFLHIVESFDEYTRLSLISKYIKAIKLQNSSKININKINIYVYNVKENKLYHFHTEQLMSSTSKGMLDIISKSFTTKAHSYDGYNILYEISRYRNSKQKPNSVDDELYNFSKDNTNIKAITHITEKYWELAKISLAITKP